MILFNSRFFYDIDCQYLKNVVLYIRRSGKKCQCQILCQNREICKIYTMSALTNLWNNYTTDFSVAQKVVIAVVLGIIFFTALMAIVLVVLEFMK